MSNLALKIWYKDTNTFETINKGSIYDLAANTGLCGDNFICVPSKVNFYTDHEDFDFIFSSFSRFGFWKIKDSIDTYISYPNQNFLIDSHGYIHILPTHNSYSDILCFYPNDSVEVTQLCTPEDIALYKDLILKSIANIANIESDIEAFVLSGKHNEELLKEGINFQENPEFLYSFDRRAFHGL